MLSSPIIRTILLLSAFCLSLGVKGNAASAQESPGQGTSLSDSPGKASQSDQTGDVATATLEPQAILIGEQAALTLTCRAQKGKAVHFPEWAPGTEIAKGVEMVRADDIVKTSAPEGLQQLSRTYYLTSFDSAIYRLPAFEIEVAGHKLKAHGDLALKVSTVEVDTVHVADFNGPYAPAAAPLDWTLEQPMWLGGCALSLLVMLLCMARLSDPKVWVKKVIIYPPVPPHIQARKELEALKSHLGNSAEAFYEALTATLRGYLQGHFGIDAHEMVSREISHALSQTDTDPEIQRRLEKVMSKADLAKYARAQASREEREEGLATVTALVDSTKPIHEVEQKPRIEWRTLSDKRQAQIRLTLRITAIVGCLLCLLCLWQTVTLIRDSYLPF